MNVRVRREPDGTLALTYSIEGDLARVRVPPQRTPRIMRGLWEHTCCECFIALQGHSGYHEFNFAPSGEWAALAFSKYREGRPLDDESWNPGIAVRRGDDRIELDASLPLARLSGAHVRGKLALAMSVVIEDDQGALSYWALGHPAGRPDFHHPDSFVLALENR